MLTAQGFQESGLDQKKRSRAGAIGVMQVMPATGRAMKVGDIRQLDPNIHAGVKYMSHLGAVYFNDPAMDSLNRALFCFASYNAGPTRISSLRRVARARGLDPDIWFDNVERVAAERIGRETIQYVVNISKYYVAYKLVEQQDRQRTQAKATLLPSPALPAADGKASVDEEKQFTPVP
jgi:membrane-bound lytic murein transglycosylase MltF